MIHHILLATNGSRNSSKAEDYALHLSKLCECLLTVLYVCNDRLYHYGEVDQLMTRSAIEEFVTYLKKINDNDCRRVLRTFSTKASKAGIPYSIRIRAGAPGKEIVATAREICADFLIMGGDDNCAGMTVIPSSATASEVLKKSTCAVLIASADAHHRQCSGKDNGG